MVLVPKGTYLVGGSTTFMGPWKCLSGFLNFWIAFRSVDGLMVHWMAKELRHGLPMIAIIKIRQCKTLPANLRFHFVKNAKVGQIHSVDSKGLHINLFASEQMDLSSITIDAPEDSSNTDGIHTGNSTFINIQHSKIGTGDDCISFSHGSKNIYVADVTCGPGHGISIGSLGSIRNKDSVMGLIINDVLHFYQYTNGVRIKTWAASQLNLVRNITFLHLIMNNVRNPVFINQEYYCPYSSCDKKSFSRVQIKMFTTETSGVPPLRRLQ
ncbi:LOW QUALITY PROTEIN: hypothetical protein AQUCO_01900043v1 [Aquilegia coerulea]|uniref:Pectate lyase superfamily protein domain-containing protein n=1 Tax=Aquilegia coerulea TaxID=218851 RepID=A0A2G5DIP5_AQUCA|nr:LOW QUALITY PROTEIN: hypothetical protein AQUCO_01900043v1 [Aquilegia coerulea]